MTKDFSYAKSLLPELKERHKEGYMNYYLVYDNNACSKYTGAYCYGNLPRKGSTYHINSVIDYVWGANKKDDMRDFTSDKMIPFRPVFEEWTNWVLNNSNWSEVCVTKDASELIENGAIFDITLSARTFFQAVATIRMPIYNVNVLSVWKYLKENTKLSPNELYIASMISHLNANKQVVLQTSENSHGHQGFYLYSLKPESMKNFLENKKIDLAASDSKIYWIMSASLWGPILGSGELMSPFDIKMPVTKNSSHLLSRRSISNAYDIDVFEDKFREFINMNWKGVY